MFDAILLASYGGPEKIGEIEPFLERVLSGKRVPSARRAAVAARYEARGGVSPLPGECRRFLEKLRTELDGAPTSVYWGNLFAPPFFDDALASAEADGVRNLLVFPTSAFGSPESCRRYVDAVRDALERRSPEFRRSLQLAQTPPFYDLPAFRRAVADALLTALAWDDLDAFDADDSRRLVLFSAHSLPTSSAQKSFYFSQLLAAATDVLTSILDAPGFGGAKVASNVDVEKTRRFPEKIVGFDASALDFSPDLLRRARENSLDAALAFQSRSGSPATPWLGPDVGDVVRGFKEKNPTWNRLIVVPLGFFFENMETVCDLDVELRAVCDELGVSYRRAECCGASDRLVRAFVELARREPTDFPACARRPGDCDFSCRLVPPNGALQ